MSVQSTPWGQSQWQKKIARGITQISTAGHGGYRISKVLAEKRISEEMRTKAGILYCGYWYFEEDCAWSAVVLSFPELYTLEQRNEASKTYGYWFLNERKNAP